MAFPVLNTWEYFFRLSALISDRYPATPNQAKLRLYQNNISPDANMTVDTFVEADYAGYAAVNLTIGNPTLNDQGLVVARSQAVAFVCDAGTAPQTIYGIYITDVDGTNVLAAQRFDVAQNVGGPYTTAVSGVWRMSEPLSSYGWIDVED